MEVKDAKKTKGNMLTVLLIVALIVGVTTAVSFAETGHGPIRAISSFVNEKVATAPAKAVVTPAKTVVTPAKAAAAKAKVATAKGKAAIAKGKAATAKGKAATAKGKAATAKGKAATAKGKATKNAARSSVPTIKIGDNILRIKNNGSVSHISRDGGKTWSKASPEIRKATSKSGWFPRMFTTRIAK